MMKYMNPQRYKNGDRTMNKRTLLSEKCYFKGG